MSPSNQIEESTTSRAPLTLREIRARAVAHVDQPDVRNWMDLTDTEQQLFWGVVSRTRALRRAIKNPVSLRDYRQFWLDRGVSA